MLSAKLVAWGIALGLCGWGSACGGASGDSSKTPSVGDSGTRAQDAGERAFSGSAHLVFAPGNAVVRGTRYRMQVEVGLSLGPQQSSTGRYRMQGASAAVIRESRP